MKLKTTLNPECLRDGHDILHSYAGHCIVPYKHSPVSNNIWQSQLLLLLATCNFSAYNDIYNLKSALTILPYVWHLFSLISAHKLQRSKHLSLFYFQKVAEWVKKCFNSRSGLELLMYFEADRSKVEMVK